MATSLRTAFISLVGFSLAAATFVTLRQDTTYRVDLESVREIWADVVHDVDKIGLGVTRISTREEVEIGDRIHYGMPILQDDPRAGYVEAVGRRIAEHARRRDMPFTFHILRTREINAFAIPGGHVYITEPMLDLIETEAEMASILGHEISHVDLRHCIERMQYQIRLRPIVGPLADVFGMAYWLLGISYEHQQESEADRSGLLLMAQAGYDPAAAVGIDQRMKERLARRAAEPSKPQGPVTEAATAVDKLFENYFHTHPEWSDRIAQFKTLIAQNESGWRDKDFCVGRVNYRERKPCFEKTFPGEMRTMDQVLEELKAAPAPAPVQVSSPLSSSNPGRENRRSPPAPPPLPPVRPAESVSQALDWGREELRAHRKEPALAYFEQALTMALAAVAPLPGDDGSDDALLRRADLRAALLADFDLARDLGRPIDRQVAPALVNYPRYDQADICRLALLPYWQEWDDREAFAPAVADAQRRGLSPVDCWWLIYHP